MKTRRTSKSGPTLIAVINFLAVMLLASTVRAQQVGYVLDINGDWSLNGNTSLHQASKLPAGGVIRANSPSDRSCYIVLAGLDGKIIEKRECRKQGECSKSIQLPQSPGIVSRVFTAIGDLVWSTPAKYVALISKGTDLNEAVVKLDGDQIDLAEVFSSVEKGVYFVKLDPVVRENSHSGKSFSPVSLEWGPGQPARARIKGLVSGLYKLSIVKPDGKGFLATDQDAWVLISNPSQYATNSDSFKEALTLTQQWGEQVHSDVVRSFLRASLDLIANH